MTAGDWRTLKELFDNLMDRTASERDAGLLQLSAENPNLADELSQLLRAHDEATPVLDHPIVDLHQLVTDSSPLLRAGEMVMKRFRIERCLGPGGMGEVYEAHDRYMGRIAIKIIRPEFSGFPHIEARFQVEAVAARSKASSPLGAVARRSRRAAPVRSLRPQLAAHWDPVIKRCLEYEPGCRYQTTADLAPCGLAR